MSMRKCLIQFFIILSVGLTLSSCSKKDHSVRVYESEKIVLSQDNSMSINKSGLESSGRNYKWETPSSWEEKEGNSIRIGSFLVKGQGQFLKNKADASIVVLGGSAGGTLSNINRWRGQISLSPIDDTKLTKSLQKFKGKLGDFNYTFIINKKMNKGILASIFSHNGNTVFVKMSGSALMLKSEEKRFIEFSRNIYAY